MWTEAASTTISKLTVHLSSWQLHLLTCQIPRGTHLKVNARKGSTRKGSTPGGFKVSFTGFIGTSWTSLCHSRVLQAAAIYAVASAFDMSHGMNTYWGGIIFRFPKSPSISPYITPTKGSSPWAQKDVKTSLHRKT